MNELFSRSSIPRKEASLSRGDLRGGQLAGVYPAALDNLLHELRQPLSIIESLAYCLERSATDGTTLAHLSRIQAMVVEAHCILERACAACEEPARKAS